MIEHLTWVIFGPKPSKNNKICLRKYVLGNGEWWYCKGKSGLLIYQETFYIKVHFQQNEITFPSISFLDFLGILLTIFRCSVGERCHCAFMTSWLNEAFYEYVIRNNIKEKSKLCTPWKLYNKNYAIFSDIFLYF